MDMLRVRKYCIHTGIKIVYDPSHILLNPISVRFIDKWQPVYCRQYEMRIQVMILDMHVVLFSK